MTKITQFPYSSYPEFLAIRNQLKGVGQKDVFRLGASDIGLILGLSEWKSVVAVFLEHCDFIPNRFQPTLDTHRGHVLESIAYEQYFKYIDPNDPDHDTYLKNYYGDQKVFRTADKTNTIFTNEDHNWLFVSPDFSIHPNEYNKGNGVLEIKFPRGFVANRYELGVPAEHVAQVQFQLFVGGFDYGILLSVEDSTTPNMFTFEVIKESKQAMLDHTHDYVQKVLAGKKIVYSDMPQLEKEQALSEISPEERNPVPYSEHLKWAHRAENALLEKEGTTDQLDTVCDYLRLKEQEKTTLTLENEIRSWFTGGFGVVDFGKSIGRVSYRSKLAVPRSILTKAEASYG